MAHSTESEAEAENPDPSVVQGNRSTVNASEAKRRLLFLL